MNNKLYEALEELANAEKANESTYFKLQLAEQENRATADRVQKARDRLSREITEAKNSFK